jgi:membrane protease YdiL (CAAX protease family)
LPAVAEEIFFRGLITKALSVKGKVFAVLGSAVIFALFHASLEQLLYPFFMGIFLAIMYLETKNLVIPIIIHFVNNLIAITLPTFEIENWILVIVGVIALSTLVGVYILWIWKKQKKDGNDGMSQTL